MINDSGDRLINACKQHDLRIYIIYFSNIKTYIDIYGKNLGTKIYY